MNSHTTSTPLARRLWLAATVFVAVALAGPAAFAEDTDDPEEKSKLEEKLDSYWSVERDLDAVKDRIYEREGRLAFGLIAGLNSSEPFFWYIPVGARLDYYFNNHAGIELEGTYMDAPGVLHHDTELTTFLKDARGDAFKPDLSTEDRFLWRANALIVWHPLYGKLAFLQRKLTHFDFNLALGGGVVQVERPDVTRQRTSTTIAPELAFGGGVHFFATESLQLRLDGRGYLYKGAETPSNEGQFGKQLQVPVEFLLGVSYMF